MNIHAVKKLLFLFAAISFVLACELPSLPAPALSNPTLAPGSLETIVAATAGAAQTQTARVVPSPTSTLTPTVPPSSTPTETLTSTATVVFIFPTATNTPVPTRQVSSVGSGCELVEQSPGNNSTYSSRERFTVEWTLRNTGNSTWERNSFDFFFSDGRDMHEKDGYDLPRNVRVGDDVTFEVAMRSPGNAGTYTSTWILGTRNNTQCRVSITIIVK